MARFLTAMARATLAPAILCALMARADAQGSFRGWDDLGDAGTQFQFDPDRTDVATFYLKASAEARFRLDNARSLIAAGRFKDAVEPLHEVVTLFPDHLYQVAARSGEGLARWVGAAEYARYLLSRLPDDAKQAYAEYAELRCGERLRVAIALRDVAALEKIAADFGSAPQGLEALRTLGGLAMEAGATERASRYLIRANELAGPSGAGTALRFRAAAALALQGAKDAAKAMLQDDAGAAVRVGGEDTDAVAALAGLDAFAQPTFRDWEVFGGDNAHVRPMAAPELQIDLTTHWMAPVFSGPQNRNPWAQSSNREFPFHPAVSDGLLVATDGLEARAYSLYSDQPRWVHRGPLAAARQNGDVNSFENYLESPTGRSALGTLARLTLVMPTIAGRNVLMPMFDATPRATQQVYDNIVINPSIPTRGLQSVDLETGKLRWSMRRPDESRNDFENRVSLTAPPLVVSDRVLVPGYILGGAINLYLLCLSLEDGSVIWKTPLAVGQQELTMFNKSFKEFTLQMPAERDGTTYLCSNLGLVLAVDTMTGALRWATQYDAIPITSSPNYAHHNERNTYWNNDPPLVAEGKVVVAPLDSDDLVVLDAATGRMVWKMRYDRTRRSYEHLLGIQDGVLILGGAYGLGFHDLENGRLLREIDSHELGPVTGRAAVGDHIVYEPCQKGLLIQRWSRGPYGVEFKSPARSIAWTHGQPGNVLLSGDFAITTSAEWLTVFFDVDALTERARLRTQDPAATAADFLMLGNLERLNNRHDAAVAALEVAAKRAGSDVELARKIDEALYQSRRELAAIAGENRDIPAQITHLKEAARHAPSNFAFLTTIEQLIGLLEVTADVPELLATLDWVDSTCPDEAFPFEGMPFHGPVKAGLYTLDRRARLAVAQGDTVRAVAAWQRMIERYGDDSFEGQPARRTATARIAAAIGEEGRPVYAAFDAEAARLHRLALEAGDAAALERVVDHFPNATDATRYRIDLGRLLLVTGNPEGVFRALSELLVGDVEPEVRAQALELTARAAEAAGDPRFALALWKRLADVGAGVPVEGGEGSTLRSRALGEVSRLGALTRATQRDPRLKGLPSLESRVMDVASDPSTQLVEIDGDGLPDGLSAVLVYEPGRLRFIDTGTLADLWSIQVDAYDSDFDPLRAWIVGDRLIVRQRKTIRALDPRTGRLFFERDLPAVPAIHVGVTSGLLLAAWEGLDDGSHMLAMELATGGLVWQRDLGFSASQAVAAEGESVAVVSRHGSDAVVLDVLTGSERFRQSLLEAGGNTEVAIFDRFGLLLASGFNSDRQKQMFAFDLRDGRPLWRSPAYPGALSVRWVHEFQDKLVVLYGQQGRGSVPQDIHRVEIVEPRTGERLQTVENLPNLCMFQNGPVSLGDDLLLVSIDALSGRRGFGSARLVRLDPMARAEVAAQPVPGLESSYKEFDVRATRDAQLCGTIDLRSLRTPQPRPDRTLVFTLDASGAGLRMTNIDVREPRFSQPGETHTPDALVVLRDGKLHVFPTEGDR